MRWKTSRLALLSNMDKSMTEATQLFLPGEDIEDFIPLLCRVALVSFNKHGVIRC